SQVEQALGKVGASGPVWAGVGAWRLPVGSVLEKIRAAREAGASGVVLFSHESFVASDLDRLREEAFTAPTAVPAAGEASRDHR
ncbi:MAG TPA: PA domain-containing protein, partial [Vicinamibacteria bacterium]|nr:PA domain-containing protein [Vicinamibacteria bacterium]